MKRRPLPSSLLAFVLVALGTVKKAHATQVRCADLRSDSICVKTREGSSLIYAGEGSSARHGYGRRTLVVSRLRGGVNPRGGKKKVDGRQHVSVSWRVCTSYAFFGQNDSHPAEQANRRAGGSYRVKLHYNMGGYGENAKKKGQENSFGVCIVN
eukprot:jgi/Bigna1/70824/fgenesh1_pg.13_\